MTEEDHAIAWATDIPQSSAKQVLSEEKENMYTERFWLGDNQYIVYYGDGDGDGGERPLPDVDSPPRLRDEAQEAWNTFRERLRDEAAQVSFLKSGHLDGKTGDEIAKILVTATPGTWKEKWWKSPGGFHRVRGNSAAASDAELRTIFIGNAPNDYTDHTGSYTSKDSTDFLAGAILAAFLDYDPSVTYDMGDITKLVWWRYREARRRCAEVTRLVKARMAEMKREIDKERRIIAARKRREKEEQQFKDLASRNPQTFTYSAVRIERKSNESDIDWGKRCFNARMRVDQQKKNAKVAEMPSEAALQRFKEWHRPDYGDYGVDLAAQGIRFSKKPPSCLSGWEGRGTRHKIPYCEMEDLLLCLNEHGLGEKKGSARPPSYLRPSGLSVTITVEIPKTNSEGFPAQSRIGFSTTKRRWSNLQGNDRTDSTISMQICGVLLDGIGIINGRPLHFDLPHSLTLILPETMSVRMMLPKEFSKFEYLNTSKTHTLQKCRRLPIGTKITNIKVFTRSTHQLLEFIGVTKSQAELADWRAERNASRRTNVAWYYRPADPNTSRPQRTVESELERVRTAKAAKAAADRKAGLARRDASASDVDKTMNKAQALLKRYKDLHDKGLISHEDYRVATERICKKMTDETFN